MVFFIFSKLCISVCMKVVNLLSLIFLKMCMYLLLIIIFFESGGCFVEFYLMFIQRNTISQQGEYTITFYQFFHW